MIILINDITELSKNIINKKNKILINSDFINLKLILAKLKKYDFKIKILTKNLYMEKILAGSSDYAILANGCYIIYDSEFIGNRADKVENKQKTITELEKIADNYKVSTGTTIGALSLNIFNKISKVSIKIDKYVLTRILDAYAGGVIMHPTKSNNSDIYEYDMRSAYPFQLQNKKFMMGVFYVYNKPVNDLFFINLQFTKIKVISNKYDILQHLKIKKEKNIYIMTITSLDYKYLIKNYIIENLKINYYINSTINDYIDDGDFVNTFYKIKTKSKSPSEKTASKLILNSLVGKLAQRRYDIKERDIRRFTLPISIYVNAYQRTELADIINKNIDSVVYSDTDSIFTNKKIKLKTGTSIGNWKIEKESIRVKFFSKRCYILQDEKYDQHLAGLATKLKNSEYKKLFKLDKNDFYNIENINKRNETLGVYTIINKVE